MIKDRNLVRFLCAGALMPPIELAQEVRTFVMPMNLLVVLLLAGSYRTLAETHYREPEGEKFLRHVMWAWVFNFIYICLEILKYRLTPSAVIEVPAYLGVLNAVTLAMSSLASMLFVEATLSIQAVSHKRLIQARFLGGLLALTVFVPIADTSKYIVVLTANVVYNAAALVLLAKGIKALTSSALASSQSILARLVYPLWLYAALQIVYLLLWIPGASPRVNNSLAAAILGAAGFALAFIFKLIHLNAVVKYSAIETIGLQRLRVEEATLQEQRRFISEMVHELKTPAVELNLRLEQLQGAVLAKSNIRPALAGVRETIARLLAIIYGAYDLVSTESVDWSPPAPVACNINNVIHSAIFSVRSAMRERSSESFVSIEPRLALNPLVQAPRSDLMQVFINLLRNSFDALPYGGNIVIKTRKVGRRGSEENAKVIIGILDDGEGIPSENIDRVLEEGFTTRAGPGRGHGLYVCRRIIESYSGMISVQSPSPETGRGAFIQITLPAATREMA